MALPQYAQYPLQVNKARWISRRVGGRAQLEVLFIPQPLQGQKGVRQHHRYHMMGAPHPTAAFVVIQPQFLLELLVVLFDLRAAWPKVASAKRRMRARRCRFASSSFRLNFYRRHDSQQSRCQQRAKSSAQGLRSSNAQPISTYRMIFHLPPVARMFSRLLVLSVQRRIAVSVRIPVPLRRRHCRRRNSA
jgi:hypothetical protein